MECVGVFSFFQFVLLSVFAMILAGCPASVSNLTKERYVWPPPPDTARIEWLKSYSSQLDIEKTASQQFWVAISGDEAPRSLLKPVEVKSVPELNKFFVSDIARGAVIVFDLAGRDLRTLDIPEGAPALKLPLSIAIDRNGNIYVLERRSASILIFDKSEKYLKSINLNAVSASNPIAMIIDKKNDHILIADAASKKIVVINLSGESVRSFGGPGNGEGQFNLPISMALNSKGHLYVGDAFNAVVQVFDTTGLYLAKFGVRGDSPGNLQLIKSLAIDSSDNVYVVDGRSHNITIFNDKHELLLVMGGQYTTATTGKIAPGGFSVPVGIDIDSTDQIFVVDQLNSRVQVFRYFSDEYLRLNPSR
jgi:DNA-binding beta-propeller fold protein YncE